MDERLQKIHQARRKRLVRTLQGGIAVIPTAPQVRRNADTHYPYRWDSHFYYLTGFTEPEAVLVVLGDKRPTSILFCRARDAAREIWDGRRVGPRRAVAALGVDEAWPMEQLQARLPQLLANRPSLHTPLGQDSTWDQQVMGWLGQVRDQGRRGVSAPAQLVDVRAALDEMRLFKDAEEIRRLKQAAHISAQAHRRAMQATVPGRYEYEIEADILQVFRQAGAYAPAYPSIVAGGANACILHYVENESVLRPGSLLLIDAGCEYQGYAGDITRTFPVNGTFSAAQRDLYQVVLAAQQAALAQVKPGKPFKAYHEAALRVLVEGLIHYKLCRGTVEAVLDSQDYQRFYMHRTGHWLGMDVHDVGAYALQGRSRPLQAGMVLTVEPGLYVRPGPHVPRAFHHLGIRIEDDVLVTPTGHSVLTAEAPKEVDEIEDWMQAAR